MSKREGPNLLLCGDCGYDLSDRRAGRCPECGGTRLAKEIRRRPNLIEFLFAALMTIEFGIGAVYFAINPKGIAALFLGVRQTSIIFTGIFLLGIVGVIFALYKPRSRRLIVFAAWCIAIAGLFGPFNAYMVFVMINAPSDMLMVLVVGGLLALNAAAALVLGHRLLYKELVYTAISVKLDADVGVLGSGQLGRMIAQAGTDLGIRCRFLGGSLTTPAAAVGDVWDDGFADPGALERFADGLDVVTYEFENVPVKAARTIASSTTLYPSPRSLEIAQDRLLEREMFTRLGIAAPNHAAIETLGELKSALNNGFPLPAILKARRLGYDGKGQARLATIDDAERAWETIAAHAGGDSQNARVPSLLDEMIPFVRELSIVAVRGRDGSMACYPPFENTHTDGILRRSICPAPGISDDRRAEMISAAKQIGDDLGHVGVFAVEFFETSDGTLLANEIAPRVHNTGHGTIEGCETSQFENHLRAILGLPLGSTQPRGSSVMLNIIGAWPDRNALLAIPGLSLHDYEKPPKPGRKIGHVTLVAEDQAALRERLASAEALINASDANPGCANNT